MGISRDRSSSGSFKVIYECAQLTVEAACESLEEENLEDEILSESFSDMMNVESTQGKV